MVFFASMMGGGGGGERFLLPFLLALLIEWGDSILIKNYRVVENRFEFNELLSNRQSNLHLLELVV
jgi:hypothetical protein